MLYPSHSRPAFHLNTLKSDCNPITDTLVDRVSTEADGSSPQLPHRAVAGATRQDRYGKAVTHTPICRPCADHENGWDAAVAMLNRCRMAARPPNLGRQHRPEVTQEPTRAATIASFRVSSRSLRRHRVVPAVRCTPSIGGSHAGRGAHWPVRLSRIRSVRLPNGLMGRGTRCATAGFVGRVGD
jgi:hypothetical protein